MQQFVETQRATVHSRDILVRRIRISSGLIVLCYVLSHFANLALGILGIVAAGRRDGFREAKVLAATIFAVGATVAIHPPRSGRRRRYRHIRPGSIAMTRTGVGEKC